MKCTVTIHSSIVLVDGDTVLYTNSTIFLVDYTSLCDHIGSLIVINLAIVWSLGTCVMVVK